MKPANGNAVNAADVRAKHKEFLFPCVANYYEESIVLMQHGHQVGGFYNHLRSHSPYGASRPS